MPQPRLMMKVTKVINLASKVRINGSMANGNRPALALRLSSWRRCSASSSFAVGVQLVDVIDDLVFDAVGGGLTDAQLGGGFAESRV